jgi:hypothetical protein
MLQSARVLVSPWVSESVEEESESEEWASALV